MSNENAAELNDALVGRLYRELVAVSAARNTLVTLVSAIKNGNVSLDRVEIVTGGVVIHPLAPTDEVTLPEEVPLEGETSLTDLSSAIRRV